SAYGRWRDESLRRQLTDHFHPDRLRGKDVLDFGCGTGELSMLLAAQYGCRTVTGLDMASRAIDQAIHARRSLSEDAADRLCFVVAVDDRKIDLPDASADVICCFDVVEHIPHLEDTAAEWFRILRPGGEVWVWWSPWRGPYGHHVESLIPLPWVHLLFSPRTVFAVCAEVYDSPDFVPRIWDLDQNTGRKRPNKWRAVTGYYPFLNRLPRTRFERIVRGEGLTIAHQETHGFGGSSKARATRTLTHVPLIGECFTSFFIYRLAKATTVL
ncbi:MAG: class I SAM-dependent methyltransferase, partial [bacterium]|nr:class I SAM-dependent methyltransferase [bacterium]